MTEKKYIEIKQALTILNDLVNDCSDKYELYSCVFDTIDNLPTADVVEVKHGKWIKPTPASQEYCNQCGLTPKMVFGILPAYCPHCGAKMDGKDINVRSKGGSEINGNR